MVTLRLHFTGTNFSVAAIVPCHVVLVAFEAGNGGRRTEGKGRKCAYTKCCCRHLAACTAVASGTWYSFIHPVDVSIKFRTYPL